METNGKVSGPSWQNDLTEVTYFHEVEEEASFGHLRDLDEANWVAEGASGGASVKDVALFSELLRLHFTFPAFYGPKTNKRKQPRRHLSLNSESGKIWETERKRFTISSLRKMLSVPFSLKVMCCCTRKVDTE